MTEPTPNVSVFLAGLLCRCPRCGKGKLFAGFLTPAARCTACDLDYAFADSGDGPAVFIILIAGAIIVGLAAITDSLFHPPAFVHLMLWIPATVILCLALLRPFKATMIALQYRHRAAEGRLS